MTAATIQIGIDTGVNTGIAIWHSTNKEFLFIGTVMIHQAMSTVEHYFSTNVIEPIHVRVEDARLRKWFGGSGREALQGAGSIKRDAKIWEDFLTDKGISFEMVAPKNNKTKLDDKQFKQITKWQGRTSVHARDAAMLVFQM